MNSTNRYYPMYKKILAKRLFGISIVCLKGIDLLLEVARTKVPRIMWIFLAFVILAYVEVDVENPCVSEGLSPHPPPPPPHALGWMDAWWRSS